MTYCVGVVSVFLCVLERNGSGVELRSLDYESCFYSTLLQFTQLYK